MQSGLSKSYEKETVKKENYNISKPVFLGGASDDAIGVASLMKAQTEAHASQFTYHEFKSGHFVMMEAKDEVNRVLLSWIEGLQGV